MDQTDLNETDQMAKESRGFKLASPKNVAMSQVSKAVASSMQGGGNICHKPAPEETTITGNPVNP